MKECFVGGSGMGWGDVTPSEPQGLEFCLSCPRAPSTSSEGIWTLQTHPNTFSEGSWSPIGLSPFLWVTGAVGGVSPKLSTVAPLEAVGPDLPCGRSSGWDQSDRDGTSPGGSGVDASPNLMHCFGLCFWGESLESFGMMWHALQNKATQRNCRGAQIAEYGGVQIPSNSSVILQLHSVSRIDPL